MSESPFFKNGCKFATQKIENSIFFIVILIKYIFNTETHKNGL